MKLSIIVPVYNTPMEKLKRCFESIKAIRTKSYECIFVDDGSIAECSAYVRSLVDGVHEFKYMYKKNGGVSSARNVGLENARGEYICFADSDDEIQPKVYDRFLSEQRDDDIVFTDLMFINKKTRIVWKVSTEKDITYEKILCRIFINGEVNGPCCKFIRKSFLLQYKICFQEEMVMGEDRVFLLDMLLQKPSMSYIDEVGYFYFREKEAGRNRIMKHFKQIYSNYREIYGREQMCIEDSGFKYPKRDYLSICSAEQYVTSIFNVTLEIIEAGISLCDVESEIKESIGFIEIKQSSWKTKIRKRLLLKQKWRILKMLAIVRRKYLEIKGLA